MQPRNVRKPSSRARSSIRLRRPDPAALGELDVDAGDDADEPVEVLGEDAALVGHDRQRRALLEPAQLVEAAGRERLLDQLDARGARARAGAPTASSGRPAGVGIDPDRAVEDGADGLERREVVRAAAP